METAWVRLLALIGVGHRPDPRYRNIQLISCSTEIKITELSILQPCMLRQRQAVCTHGRHCESSYMEQIHQRHFLQCLAVVKLYLATEQANDIS